MQSRRRECSCAFGRVTSPAIVTVRIKVTDVWSYRFTDSKIRGIVPPVIDPITYGRIIAAGEKPCLQGFARTGRANEVVDCGFRVGVFAVGEKRADGGKIAACGFCESRYWKTREGIFESEHGAF